jgi:hypothetical protein
MKDGHYRVFLEGRWIEVPDDAIVVAPNKYGRAIVWPYSVYVGNENAGGELGSDKDYQDSLLHARSASVSEIFDHLFGHSAPVNADQDSLG